MVTLNKQDLETLSMIQRGYERVYQEKTMELDDILQPLRSSKNMIVLQGSEGNFPAVSAIGMKSEHYFSRESIGLRSPNKGRIQIMPLTLTAQPGSIQIDEDNVLKFSFSIPNEIQFQDNTLAVDKSTSYLKINGQETIKVYQEFDEDDYPKQVWAFMADLFALSQTSEQKYEHESGIVFSVSSDELTVAPTISKKNRTLRANYVAEINSQFSNKFDYDGLFNPSKRTYEIKDTLAMFEYIDKIINFIKLDYWIK